jgi:leader peptidase (prepilin peptidase)/N-methyltransferase
MEIFAALNQQPLLLALGLLFVGLTVGSFLNVVIYRVPAMIEREERAYCTSLLSGDDEAPALEPFNLAIPGSRCPHCGHAIRPWENIPVLSYIALRGRCSACKRRISVRYPIIEATSAALALLLGTMLGAGGTLLAALVFTWALLALTMIDIDTMLLPDNITLPLLWLGLFVNLFGTFAPLRDAVIGAIAGYGVLWSVFWLFKLATGKEGMGYGDFKLLGALGAWLGWQALPMIILLSSLVGAVLGIIVMYLEKRGRDIPMPFGPYLAIAGWIAMVWGDQIMNWYWATMGAPHAP